MVNHDFAYNCLGLNSKKQKTKFLNSYYKDQIGHNPLHNIPRMEYNFNNLIIDKAIMHTIVPKKVQSAAYADHAEEPFDLEVTVQETLRKRLVEAVGRRGRAFQLSIQKSEDGSFCSLCSQLKNCSDTEFVQVSKSIANLLADSQTSSKYPGGFLLIVKASDNETKKDWYITIKAEPHEALISSVRNGKTYIEMLDKIFLSPTQKLFKIGMLQEVNLEAKNINQKYNSYLFDDQFSTIATPAAYFYEKFLGFSLESNGEIQSAKFYTTTEEFIKKSDLDPDEKDSLLDALKVEVHSNNEPYLRPQDFAAAYFADEELRMRYRNQVASELPDTIKKSTSLINNRVNTKKIDFPSNIKILGPDVNFNKQVTIIKDQEALDNLRANNENVTIVVIKGKPYSSGR